MATGKKECVMIELKNNHLVFSFPEVHPQAKLVVEFQRTLRIPDDGEDYSLPPGLGNFPYLTSMTIPMVFPLPGWNMVA
jgi:hypothetical protein